MRLIIGLILPKVITGFLFLIKAHSLKSFLEFNKGFLNIIGFQYKKTTYNNFVIEYLHILYIEKTTGEIKFRKFNVKSDKGICNKLSIFRKCEYAFMDVNFKQKTIDVEYRIFSKDNFKYE